MHQKEREEHKGAETWGKKTTPITSKCAQCYQEFCSCLYTMSVCRCWISFSHSWFSWATFSLAFFKAGTGEFPSWLPRSGQCPKGSGVWELEAAEFSEANKNFCGFRYSVCWFLHWRFKMMKHGFTDSVVCRFSSFLFLAGTAVFVCLVGEPSADPSAVDLWGLGECVSMFFNRDAYGCIMLLGTVRSCQINQM